MNFELLTRSWGQGIKAFSLEELSDYAHAPEVAQSANNFITFNERLFPDLQRAVQAFAALPAPNGMDMTLKLFAQIRGQYGRVKSKERAETYERLTPRIAEQMKANGIALDLETRTVLARDASKWMQFFRSTFPPVEMNAASGKIMVTLSAVRDAEDVRPSISLVDGFQLLRVDYSGKSFAWWKNEAVNRGQGPKRSGWYIMPGNHYYLSDAGDATFVRGGLDKGLANSLFLPRYPDDHPRVYLEIKAMPS